MSRRKPRRTRKTRTKKGGGPGNVNPAITEDLRAILREIDEVLDMPGVTPMVHALETLRTHTTRLIRRDNTYPLPVLVAYHRTCAPLLRTIREEIEELPVDNQSNRLDEHVSMMMKGMHRIKVHLPRNRTRRSRTSNQV